MPAYNADKFIKEAIQSVVNQSYKNWELIIINDGSTDTTERTIFEFNDNRIKYFFQSNRGVSSARNVGLENMKGSFFCFLDADDIMPLNSLQGRLEVFYKDPLVHFVDGTVICKDVTMSSVLKRYTPKFKGQPFDQLLRINDQCLFGNTWMVRKEDRIKYHFNENMTHAEDLYFYLTISQNRNYTFTSEEVLHYRISGSSAMSNLKGLEDGYFKLYSNVKDNLKSKKKQLLYLKYRIIRIMMLSYLFVGKDPWSAIKVFFKYLRA